VPRVRVSILVKGKHSGTIHSKTKIFLATFLKKFSCEAEVI
jgi:hypothetical protein